MTETLKFICLINAFQEHQIITIVITMVNKISSIRNLTLRNRFKRLYLNESVKSNYKDDNEKKYNGLYNKFSYARILIGSHI